MTPHRTHDTEPPLTPAVTGARPSDSLGSDRNRIRGGSRLERREVGGVAPGGAREIDVAVGVPAIELQTVRGKVLDSEARSVAGVQVGARVEVEVPGGFGARFEVIFDATNDGEWSRLADATGRFALQGMPIIFGSRIRATLDGYEPAEVDIAAACAVDTVFRMKRTQSDSILAGLVLDVNGTPASGARVSLGQHSAVADSAGRFRLDRTGAEDADVLTAVVHGCLPGHVSADGLEEDGTPAWPAMVVVYLGGPPLALAGRVVDQHGAPRSGVRIWLDDPTRFGDVTASPRRTVRRSAGRAALL